MHGGRAGRKPIHGAYTARATAPRGADLERVRALADSPEALSALTAVGSLTFVLEELLSAYGSTDLDDADRRFAILGAIADVADRLGRRQAAVRRTHAAELLLHEKVRPYIDEFGLRVGKLVARYLSASDADEFAKAVRQYTHQAHEKVRSAR